ncbi:hypothetical protein [Leucobacter chromiireducens]|uniref:hypothetical protein n=1 Tax=Leucobacter chromiireducens TaxID=283877 RepID=UPI001928A130|nr:hypothetical protein [Leucobacter chromiireducens]
MIAEHEIQSQLDVVAASLATCWSQRHRSTPAAVQELARDWGDALAAWLREELPLAWMGTWLASHILYEVREGAGAIVRSRDPELESALLANLPAARERAREDLRLWQVEHDREQDWEAQAAREWAAEVRARRAAEERL